ncbi:MAG: serine hydrolase, partial [Clostridia bacterium]|nr:serine hydrolase [Clostridia bacterium]
MFENVRPESVGIKSNDIFEYINYLTNRGIAVHNLLLIKGNKIFGEFYWKPFHKDFLHRQYSQTKSFLAVAIGLLEEEGKLSLDDKVYKYFPDKTPANIPNELKEQTVKDMMLMETAIKSPNWFAENVTDRTAHYLNSPSKKYSSGMLWEYDSPGSQVLCSLIERVANMPLLDYLKQKLFNKMGYFENAEILKTPTGESWGDSAMLCTARDMAAFGRFVMNYGTWNNERLMNEQYLKTATSPLVSNKLNSFYDPFFNGYGYQIWSTEQNGFSFNGMGGQFTVCLPEKDLIMVFNGDNQGYSSANSIIINGYFDYIVNRASENPIEENNEAYSKLEALKDTLVLCSIQGAKTSKVFENINKKSYKCDSNPMQIESFSLSIEANKGVFAYKNAQG